MKTPHNIILALLLSAIFTPGSAAEESIDSKVPVCCFLPGQENAAESEHSRSVDGETDHNNKKFVRNSAVKVWDGLVWDTMDSRLKLRVGAYFLFDFTSVNNDGGLANTFGSGSDSFEVRDAVFDFNGHFFRKSNFRVQLELESGKVELGDFYLERNEIGYLGNLRVGHFVEPFGLERTTSLRHVTFMERSLATAFTPGKNAGAMLSNLESGGRVSWALGVFNSTDTADSVADTDSLNLTARLTGLPYYVADGRRFAHLGLSLTHSKPDNEFGFRPRPESFEAPRYLDTGIIRVDGMDGLNGEVAIILGPLSFQGEYTLTWLDDAKPVPPLSGGLTGNETGNPLLSGSYIQASYFLTGEHRPYVKAKGAFGQVSPARNFGFGKTDRGLGAWEVAARISNIDMNDGFIRGGRQTNYTLGLNWYLNQTARMTVNYIHADVNKDTASGESDIFQLRFQLDFSSRALNNFAQRPTSR